MPATNYFQEYFNWTVNEVIHIEFIRNMLLALLCVLFLTLIMLADLKLCVMVFVCVLFTLASLKHVYGGARLIVPTDFLRNRPEKLLVSLLSTLRE